MLRKKYITIFLLSIIIFLLLNIGRYFDVTVLPQKADIIVCLGGGGSERVRTAVSLYQRNLSSSKKLVFTGSASFNRSIAYTDCSSKFNKKEYFIHHGVPESALIHIPANNTMEEVRKVKWYMLRHNLRKVLFVTDPPHSRRVLMLANVIARYSFNGLDANCVGSDVGWWDPQHPFANKNSTLYIILEMIKIPYNYVAYGVLERYHLLHFVKESLGSHFHKIKRYLLDKISRQWEKS